jgi:capsular exopolysaccharide synthesis family protein
MATGGGASQEPSGFQKLLRTLRRRQSLFLFVFGLTTVVLAANTLRQRILNPVYVGGFRLLVFDPLNPSGNTPSGVSSAVENVARSTINANIPSLIELLGSPLLLDPIAKQQKISLSSLISGLKITASGGPQSNTGVLQSNTGVLNVSLLWNDPVEGRRILTALAENYPNYALEQRQEKLGQGLAFLDQQAPALQKRLATLQDSLKRFRESNGFLEPSVQGSAIIGERDSLLSSLRSLQVQQSTLDTQLASIRAGKLVDLGAGSVSIPIRTTPTPSSSGTAGLSTPSQVSSSQGLQRSGPSQTRPPANLGLSTAPRADPQMPASGTTETPQDRLNQLELSIASARSTYRGDSPQVQALVAQRDKLRPLVQQQASDQVTSQLFVNRAQQDEISRQILLLNDNFKRNPDKIRQYDELEQRLIVARQNFLSYIEARENFRLEVAKETVPWKILTPPEFGDIPVKPNLFTEFIRALLIGAAAGVGVVLLRERTDNVFHTPKEVEQDLNLPVLGLIPYLPLDPSRPVLQNLRDLSSSERFAVKESLRSLFTTFRLLRADREIRLIVLSSATQGEGKSTAATIFASTLADLGQKILLIDADLRIPRQHEHFGIDNTEGLSNLLSDNSLEMSSMIREMEQSPNLSILTAGPRPPDPGKLLNSQRMVELISQIRKLKDYDIILFDSPPSLLLSDPVLLGEKVDGILYLVGLGKVDREIVPQALQRIRATGVDILGLICNQVAYPTRLNDYGYQYGYHYNYAYSSSYRDTYGKARASADTSSSSEGASALPAAPEADVAEGRGPTGGSWLRAASSRMNPFGRRNR